MKVPLAKLHGPQSDEYPGFLKEKTMKSTIVTIERRRKRQIIAVLLLSMATVGFGPFTSSAQDTPIISQAPTAQPDIVLIWNEHAANSIFTVAGQPPTRGIILLAMVHLAIYDAVNAINGYRFSVYAVRPNTVFPASPEAATAKAAHDVLVALFPNQQADLDAKYAASLATITDDTAKVNGITVGQQTAAGIIMLRANDGRNGIVPYTPGNGPGAWQPTPPGFLPALTPEIAKVQPLTLSSPSQFRAEPPPALNSETWVRDYNEVKQLGVATASGRTPEQTDLARFISDQPTLQWNRAWRGISIARGLSLVDNARFFAMLTTAGADAIIACWDSKFFYNFWRPVTAIRAGDKDGSSETAPDPNWIAVVVTPNHPEYPSAHGCLSGASIETLKYFFAADRSDFQMDSKVAGLTQPVRSYAGFSQALDDILNARVYGGMHYRNSTEKGALIGKQVSNFATQRFFSDRFTVCLQDDRSGDLLRFNWLTGEYTVTRCGTDGFTLTGVGRISRVGCLLRLADAKVSATIRQCPVGRSPSGAATIHITPLGPTVTLHDSDTSDNTCTCK
jgi:hypothetical protein